MIALIIALLGIGLLASYMAFAGFEEIEDYSDLEELELNSKVILRGVVESERIFDDFSIFSVNGINVICDCTGKFAGFEVKIEGLVTEYNGKKQIEAIEISILL